MKALTVASFVLSLLSLGIALHSRSEQRASREPARGFERPPTTAATRRKPEALPPEREHTPAAPVATSTRSKPTIQEAPIATYGPPPSPEAFYSNFRDSMKRYDDERARESRAKDIERALNRYRKQLELSDSQLISIEQILRAFEDAMIQLPMAIDIDDVEASAEEATKHSARREELWNDLVAKVAPFLTAEQVDKLQKMKEGHSITIFEKDVINIPIRIVGK